MNVLVRTLTFLLLVTAVASAQPVVGADGIVNNASYFSSVLPGGSIAQGSIFAVFGSRLGPADLLRASSFPLQTNLGGTSIRVTVGGTAVDAIILYTIAGQVGAILPSNTPVGTGTLTVTFNGQTSSTAPIRVVASSFGIFTANSQGSGPAAAQDAVTFATRNVTSAFQPGENAILYGTGLGAITGSDATPPPVGSLNVDAQLFVGGRVIPTQYRGRAPGFAGLDQINFIVPSGLEGCAVPVYLKVGGVVSNFATIAIATNGRVCSDLTGYSADDLSKVLGSSGTFSAGSVVLSRTSTNITLPAPIGTIQGTMDTGGAAFVRYTLNNLQLAAGQNLYTTFGSCVVSVFRGSSGAGPSVPFTGLDAGPALTVSGPSGSKQLPPVSTGTYAATLGGGIPFPGGPAPAPLFLGPGSYTVTGPGGRDIGAFSKTITIPPLLTWTNQDSINAVTRSQGVTVTWSGAAASSFVVITGSSGTANPRLSVSFYCTERGEAGQFTVPPEVLSLLPATTTDTSGNLSLFNAPIFSQASSFTATGLDVGYFTYLTSITKIVGYQ